MHERNDTKPHFTIVIPMYNAEQYYKTVEDYIYDAKEYSSFFEIIIVNDGSTDDSYNQFKILEEYYDNVFVLDKIHEGLSAARNYGLRYAKGQYVLFTDVDDQLYLKKLICDFKDKEKFDLTVFSFLKGNYIVDTIGRELTDEVVEIHCIKGFLEKNYKKFGGPVWNKIYNLKIIKENKIEFVDEHEIATEDILFNLMYLSFCKNVEFVNDIYYYYYLHENSISHTKTKDISLVYHFAKCPEIIFEYWKGRNINIPDFCFYFFVKEFLLGQRSYVNDNEEMRLEELAQLWKENKFVNSLLDEISDNYFEWFISHDSWNESLCNNLKMLIKNIKSGDFEGVKNKIKNLIN